MYKVERINLTDRFGLAKNPHTQQDFYLAYTKLGWLPSKVSREASEIFREARDKAREKEKIAQRDPETGEVIPDDEDIDAGFEQMERMLPVLARVVDDWNLIYERPKLDSNGKPVLLSEDGFEEEVTEWVRLPLPRQIIKRDERERKLAAEEGRAPRMSLIFEVPSQIIMALIDEALNDDGTEIPLANDQKSSSTSLSQDLRPARPLPELTHEAEVESALSEIEAKMKANRESLISPTGSDEPRLSLVGDGQNVS